MPGPLVLIVDDDEAIRTALQRGLERAGFSAVTASDGLEGLAQAQAVEPAAIVLDVGMPGISGVELTRRLRAVGSDVPICILSARGEVDDRVAGLQAGADDYVSKPFATKEVAARLHALLRRRPAEGPDRDLRSVGDLRVDRTARHASRGDRELELTRREWELLDVLATNRDVVLSREHLLELVWGYDFEVDTNVVDVFVGYLRRKLEAEGEPRMIHTVRGVGFILRSS
jgi:two-component system, OmpR family, response regulator PrrA